MCENILVYRLAGIMTILSGLLTYFHSSYWAFFSIFIGLNVFQYSFSKFCLGVWILKTLKIVNIKKE